MTSWIDWRTEPIMDIPNVEIIASTIQAVGWSPNVPEEFKNTHVTIYDVVCDDAQCVDVGFTNDFDEAERMRNSHVEWHENGKSND